eukprot:s1586_g21.t1
MCLDLWLELEELEKDGEEEPEEKRRQKQRKEEEEEEEKKREENACGRSAVAVSDILRCACVCGRVAIVTLAQHPWVLNSAAKYLPGLASRDLPGLLEELDIPVIYARQYLKRYVLRKLYGREAPWMNVLSIGDSTVERTAIMELMWRSAHEAPGAVRSLSLEAGQTRHPVVVATEEEDLGDWEIVEEQSTVPGAPVDFNSSIRFQLEDGPPATPEFLVRLAQKKLRSAVASAETRAREAFCAGFWFRITILCDVKLESSYHPALPPSVWLVQKDEGIFNLARTSTRKEAEKLCQSLQQAVIVERFPSLTELQIFCAGAQVPVPPLLKWRSGP